MYFPVIYTEFVMFITLVVFFLILSVLVLIHEFGHFIAAKKFGIRVEEFGFGLPPRVWGKKIGETIYSINWLPIGGFVRLFGEESEEDGGVKIKNIDRAFYARPLLQRTIVIVAGVVMNFILAVFIISFLYTQGVPIDTRRVHIEMVEKDSPAELGGLKRYDVLLEFNKIKLLDREEFIKKTNDHLGEEVTLTVLRGANLEHYQQLDEACPSCEVLNITLVPRKDPPEKYLPPLNENSNFTVIKKTVRKLLNIKEPEVSKPLKEGPIGVVISQSETITYSPLRAPFVGLFESVTRSLELGKGIAVTIWKLISLQPVSKDIAGPIGIAQFTGMAITLGKKAVLELLGLLSLNLAIVNILPFPALDGGRLLFILIEGISGKRVKLTWERYIHQIGMVILLTLIVLVTVNDLMRIISQ
ncbi:RIP metalloprotease RseP [Candidatus Gottesmanbacteria bacterium RIFCSPLOWO2_01_FULL_39_12b]|uniref:Zinc metalloprotease n=1 Tax=Candidatus Gottesmanbacteria bacterium RIFCSPLOWO2_01_FULL_39_12b TaxID=1798388 RepID=A0A1F6AQS8_9BACT|nr:MAG: RIP metalloprotease RseP [Candidatus Gottesmanbacteria bacterium RIFCSPLOWO2_01_FULL_39_12b]